MLNIAESVPPMESVPSIPAYHLLTCLHNSGINTHYSPNFGIASKKTWTEFRAIPCDSGIRSCSLMMVRYSSRSTIEFRKEWRNCIETGIRRNSQEFLPIPLLSNSGIPKGNGTIRWCIWHATIPIDQGIPEFLGIPRNIYPFGF